MVIALMSVFCTGRNYPTAANIARKAKLAAEKKARGEVAQTPLHRSGCYE